ncbi:U2 snRNP auxilliary factor [Striga asiatica]|uniref:U2 snRNP auxilliary factor n=1 Tax=Striga asiatica TaxID=4170 RepID=A0A5A7Q2U5_STRAF|nr:U2 snRNP auxilliary factor [Striga asiatica]
MTTRTMTDYQITDSTSSDNGFIMGFFAFSRRESSPRASDTSSELHLPFWSTSENRSAFSGRAIWWPRSNKEHGRQSLTCSDDVESPLGLQDLCLVDRCELTQIAAVIFPRVEKLKFHGGRRFQEMGNEAPHEEVNEIYNLPTSKDMHMADEYYDQVQLEIYLYKISKRDPGVGRFRDRERERNKEREVRGKDGDRCREGTRDETGFGDV